MLITERQRSWLEQRRPGVAHPVMQFVEDRLELGAGTILAQMAGDSWLGRGLDLDGRETRILALLAAAYRQPIALGVLDHLRRAGDQWARGEACLAQIHLALTGLSRLSDPEDAAYRLFMAEGLMDEGVAPRDILRALDLDPAPLDRLEKAYYDTEPRVPQGSGRPSGRWTDGAAGAGMAETTSIGSIGAVGATAAVASGRLADAAGSFLSPEIGETTLAALSKFASTATVGAIGAVAALGLVFIPSPGDSSVSEGEIPGHEGWSYHWDEEAGRLVLSTQIGDVKMPLVDAHVGLDGVYYANHHPIARAVAGHLVIDPDAFTIQKSAAEKLPDQYDTDWTVVRLADLLPKARPKLCPDPGLDARHGASEKARAYQEWVTGLPRGLGVWLRGVVFDGCDPETGNMLEAKDEYAQFLDKERNWWSKKAEAGIIQELFRQSTAARDRRVEWHVSELPVANKIREMVVEFDLTNVDVMWDPKPK